MRENSIFKERILQYLDYKDISKYECYQNTGITNGVLSQKGGISEDNILKFLSYYVDVDTEWLLTGKGKMLKADKEEANPPKRKLIPFYDAEAEAGTMVVSSMDPVAEPVEWIDAGDWFQDADSAMRVHGDSMFPEYKSGNIVAMREVFNKELVVFGEDYVIQTSEYKVIKRLMQSENKGYWLACSVNDEVWEKGKLAGRLLYEPFEIFIDDVTKLYRVIGCVKRTESSRIVYNNRNRK